MSGGRKDDQGKDPWHLIPWDAVRGISNVLAFGAGKYQPRNWERGMDWSRPFSACIRHLTAWHEGEKADPETGMSHLWHAGACIVFLIAYEIRGVGTDDRPAVPDVPDEHEEGELLWSAAARRPTLGEDLAEALTEVLEDVTDTDIGIPASEQNQVVTDAWMKVAQEAHAERKRSGR